MDFQAVKSALSEDDINRILSLWFTTPIEHVHFSEAAQFLGVPEHDFLKASQRTYKRAKEGYTGRIRLWVENEDRRTDSHIQSLLEGRSVKPKADSESQGAESAEPAVKAAGPPKMPTKDGVTKDGAQGEGPPRDGGPKDGSLKDNPKRKSLALTVNGGEHGSTPKRSKTMGNPVQSVRLD